MGNHLCQHDRHEAACDECTALYRARRVSGEVPAPSAKESLGSRVSASSGELVTCGAYSEVDPPGCVLPVGHEGNHMGGNVPAEKLLAAAMARGPVDAGTTSSGQTLASVEDVSAPAADPLSVECSFCLAKPGKPCRFSRAGARMAGARKGDPCNPHITRVERARLSSHSAEADRG